MILIIGCHGQVGTELALQATILALPFIAVERSELDIADAQAVENYLLQHRPKVVINAAAYTAVDKAESERELAFAVNAKGCEFLAKTCAAIDAVLLHISTDYIFDGEKSQAYVEDDAARPLGVYGLSKWEGELAVRTYLSRHIILRVSWVFGVYGNNFVKTMIRLAKERTELRVVMDQLGAPTFAGDIAAVLLELAQRILQNRELPWGTFHYCGKPFTNWHGFATTIIAMASAKIPIACQSITPITTAQFPTPVRRPLNSQLNCERLSELELVQPLWIHGLSRLIHQLD